MKHHKSGIKVRNRNAAHQTQHHGIKSGGADAQKHNPANPTQRKITKDIRKPMLPRWVLIVLCILIAGSCAFALGSWVFTEFAFFNRLPPALVGKWEVYEGDKMQGAVFDFSRFGSLEAHLPSPDPNKTNILVGSAAVEDKKLFITTQNPNTKRDETRTCVIRELTPTTLIVEFEKGEVFKMHRVK